MDLPKAIHFLSSPELAQKSTTFCKTLVTAVEAIGDDQSQKAALLDALSAAVEEVAISNGTSIESFRTTGASSAGQEEETPSITTIALQRKSMAIHRKTNAVHPAGMERRLSRRLTGTEKGDTERALRMIESKRRSKRRGSTLASRRKSIQAQLLLMQESNYILPQDHPFRLGWDIYMMTLILYYAVMVPVRVSFDTTSKYPGLEHFFTACFIFDIGLNFNTSFKIKGMVIKDRREIAKSYLGGWFWIDLVASFPFEVLTMSSENSGSSGSVNKLGRLSKIFRLLRIMKLLRLLKLGRIMTRLRQSMQVNPNMMLLARTVAVMVFTLHWAACGYWFIVSVEGDVVHCNEDPTFAGCNSWHPPPYIKQSNLDMKYAYALFWGVSVTTGAGWDVIPGTQGEVAYSSVMIIVGTMLYITIIGSVTSIVSNINVQNSKKMQQLDALFAYLKTRMVSKTLQKKIRGYYEFMWDEGIDQQAPRYIDALPDSLQIELAREMHASILMKVPIFVNLAPETVFFLVNHWCRSVFMPRDLIVREGDIIDRMYIIIRGSVRVFVKSDRITSIILAELKEGQFFGESTMINTEPVQQASSVRAIEFCELLYIEKSTYDEMVQIYQLRGLGRTLEREARKRRARMRWKKAIAQVRAVNRLRGAAGVAVVDIENSVGESGNVLARERSLEL